MASRDVATAATDITGFGLVGQAQVLADNADVGIEVTKLPIIEGNRRPRGCSGTASGTARARKPAAVCSCQSPSRELQRSNPVSTALTSSTVVSDASPTATAFRLRDPTIEPISREKRDN